MKKMRHISILMAIVIIGCSMLISCKSRTGNNADKSSENISEVIIGANQLTDEEIEDGWVMLFDGATTGDWRAYNKEAFPDSGWAIEDGNLKCLHSGTGEAGSGGDILYDKIFKNFHLKVEWMIEEGGNSGIFYLGQELSDNKIWYTALEYQILDNFSNHVDNILGVDGNRQAGSLYDLIPPKPQNAKGAMQWNSAEIMVYEGTVVHFMNGENVMEYHLWTEEWNSMIENSKFPEFNPGFANVAKEGYICLQDHGHATWFRNIKIKEL